MKNDSNVRFYNILLPLWLIIFLPSYLWLGLIPLNYIIDRVVLRWSLGDMPDKGLFCRKHTWKICLAGFLSDLIGALILLAVMLLAGDSSKAQSLIYAVTFDPFSKFAGLLIVVAAIAVSGVCMAFWRPDVQSHVTAMIPARQVAMITHFMALLNRSKSFWF